MFLSDILANMQKISDITFPVINMYQRRILRQTITQTVSAMLRQIDMKSRLQKIISQLIVFRCRLRISVADYDHTLWFFCQITHHMDFSNAIVTADISTFSMLFQIRLHSLFHHRIIFFFPNYLHDNFPLHNVLLSH